MGFQRRFDAGYVAARDLVASGDLGTLYVVRMAGHDPAPPHEDYIPASGGIFRDFSVHDFDALRFVTGQEIVEVYADGGVLAFPVFARYDDVDTAVATSRLSEGALGILSVTRHDPLGYDIRMELLGLRRQRRASAWDDRTPLRSVEPGSPPAPADAYPDFQNRFARCVPLPRWTPSSRWPRARGPARAPARTTSEAMRVAVACDRSRHEHRPVRVEEVA